MYTDQIIKTLAIGLLLDGILMLVVIVLCLSVIGFIRRKNTSLPIKKDHDSNESTSDDSSDTILSDLDTYIFASNNILQSRFIYECKVNELPKNMTLNEFNEAVIASINYTCRASTGLGDVRFSGYVPLRKNQNLTFFIILDVRKGINPASIVTDLTSRSTIASFSIISIRPIVDDDQISTIIQNIANECRNAMKGGE